MQEADHPCREQRWCDVLAELPVSLIQLELWKA